MTSKEQELADILTCFVEGRYNTERQLLAFAQMAGHLIMTEDLAIDREVRDKAAESG